MPSVDYFRTMARYNRWMNGRIYEHCADIPDAVRKEDRGAFFKSMHGTLNHLLLVDLLWLGRLNVQPYDAAGLDQEVCSDFDELRRRREQTDRQILAWVDTLTEESLAATMTFPFGFGDQRKLVSHPLWFVAMQLFNHQTHHRGQLTTLMMQAGVDPGVTDLLRMPDGTGA